jgi:tetratricopeptide (TPR) repeat protein
VRFTEEPKALHVETKTGAVVQRLSLDAKESGMSFLLGRGPLLGLGEGGPQFDRKGTADPMIIGQGGYRLATHGTRAPIQWLIGTDGWGMFIHQPYGAFDFTGTEGKFQPKIALPLDVFVVASKDPRVLLCEYARLTGLPEMPPLWSLGYQQSHRTLGGPEEILGIARTLREKKLPCDTLIYLGTEFAPSGWNTRNGEFTWHPTNFPEPRKQLAALHDEQLAQRFGDRRWFIRCDGASSAETLLSGLAAELGVIGGGPGSVTGRVGGVLDAGPGVVVLDNFETPWAADPLPVEELLRMIAAVPRVGVAVSSRGTGRPAGLRWRDFAMLSPLPLAEARRVFLAVAGPGLAADPRLDELVGGLDGVPLAVELLAYAAQGQPDLAEVAQRWRAERTGMLARMGGTRRELSVAVSVETSVTSPLMTAPGRRLLGLLGVLPDGVARDDLAGLMPDDGLAAAAVLRQLGLAFGEGDRLRTLAPVREHVAATHWPEPADLDQAVSHYARFAAVTGAQVGGADGAQAAARLQAETGNIAAMLERAAADARTGELAEAMSGLAEYWRITGFTQPALITVAGQAIQAHGTPFQQAQTWQAFGDLAIQRSDLDGARAAYEQALPLYQRVGDVLGEANCIRSLGDIALRRSDLDGARAAYEQALPLYQRVGSVPGEANCIKSLGDIALRRSDHDGARAAYEQALPLYQRVGSVLGEANCIQRLGDIALDRSDLDGARAAYEQALPLYQAIPEPYSVGWTLMRLARLFPGGSSRARR